jgi:hypothetical protein
MVVEINILSTGIFRLVKHEMILLGVLAAGIFWHCKNEIENRRGPSGGAGNRNNVFRQEKRGNSNFRPNILLQTDR